MIKKSRFLIILVLAVISPAIMILLLAMSGEVRSVAPPRPEGPCDIYTAAGSPCVAAHSSTRALYEVLQWSALPGHAAVGRQDP